MSVSMGVLQSPFHIRIRLGKECEHSKYVHRNGGNATIYMHVGVRGIL